VLPPRLSICLPIVMRLSQPDEPATSTQAPTTTVAPPPVATPATMATGTLKSGEPET
jgi:hypothetical protein